MTFTEDEARALICPIARVKGHKEPPARCEGGACMLWRWVPLTAHTIKPHVQARIKELGGSAVHHKAAVAWVMENREALGIPTKPTHGYCGLGGPSYADRAASVEPMP